MKHDDDEPLWKHAVALSPVLLFFIGIPFVFFFVVPLLGEAFFLAWLLYVTAGGFGAMWGVVKLSDWLDLL